MNPDQTREAVARIVAYFEQLRPEKLHELDVIYTQNATFKDPFNEVDGLTAIRKVYAHMFLSLHDPRFVVTGNVVQGQDCFLTWEFIFRFRRFNARAVQTIRGCSHLRLADDGRIHNHRDYWDAAEELYEKLPLVGALMRWLKRRAAT